MEDGGERRSAPAILHSLFSILVFDRYSARACLVGSADSAFSRAPVSCGESGLVLLAKRAMTLPLRSTRNFAKFHSMSPAKSPSVSLLVRNLYSACWSSPLTLILLAIGNDTLYLPVQNFLISASVPGSWPLKLLAGMPITTRSLSLYFSYSDSSASYCGVRPHLLATLTSNTGLPL